MGTAAFWTLGTTKDAWLESGARLKHSVLPLLLLAESASQQRSSLLGIMAVFESTITHEEAALSAAPNLEPSFEHLLRNSVVPKAIIYTLRPNEIVDKDTFVNLFGSESKLKDGAADLGIDLSGGGLPHKLESARVVTCWETAKAISETKLQTDAVARAHGLPVTLLPADWTAIMARS